MEQWEAQGKFPAHKVFKILGDAGFLGVTKPVGRSGGFEWGCGGSLKKTHDVFWDE